MENISLGENLLTKLVANSKHIFGNFFQNSQIKENFFEYFENKDQFASLTCQ